ncbi:MAG: flavin reductase family protein [Rikenellaceae bacterium]
MNKIDIKQHNNSFIELISKDWALLTSGDDQNFNTMTVSWGGIGFLWNKPVAFVFVRGERYTFEYLERTKQLTLSFLKDEFHKAHSICGSKSGRTCNKVEEAGLTPIVLDSKQVCFEESKLVLECRVMYSDVMDAENYIDKEALDKWYGAKGGMHKMYVAEIENAYTL